MHHIRLECVKRSRNPEKFYEIELSGSLFGDVVMLRRWGRIGTEGSAKAEHFSGLVSAESALVSLCRRKLARGYRLVSDSAGIMTHDAMLDQDSKARTLRAAEMLDLLLRETQAGAESRFGRIAASLASACRKRARGVTRIAPPQQSRAAWLLDDTEFRIKARIFQLLDEFVSGVLTEGEEQQIFRMIQTAPCQGPGQAAVRLVPRTQDPYLNLRLREFLAEDHGLDGLMRSLADAGVDYIGELVQLDCERVLAMVGCRHAVRQLEARLHEVGLGLGAGAPHWRRAA